MKYPIGIQSFEQIREDGFVYVDKTALIYDMVQTGNIYFLSRPRRFGKSLLVSTLENYFLGHKELFRGLAIDSLEKEWATYPVFHLDFNGQNFTSPLTLSQALETFVAKAEEKYGKDKLSITLGDRFASVLAAAHGRTGRRAVVLIDEYDKPLLDVMNSGIVSPVVAGDIKTLEDYNREILKGFYSVFKLADSHVNINELAGKEYDAAEFVDYKATKQKPLPMLYQSGYFTIKGYNPRRNNYVLDFPNEEVRSGLVSLLASDDHADAGQIQQLCGEGDEPRPH